MAKPDSLLAELIWSHPRSNWNRPPELLHITLLGLFDLALFPAEVLDRLRELMAIFDAAPFRVVFDHIDERRVVALRGSEPMQGAEAFQQRFSSFLKARGFPFFGHAPEPHLTINYRKDRKGMTLIDPISWEVEELLLIESVYGKATHIVHDRWKLSGRTDDDTGVAPLARPAPHRRSPGIRADARD
jgi:2'-5' RNA ligase